MKLAEAMLTVESCKFRSLGVISNGPGYTYHLYQNADNEHLFLLFEEAHSYDLTGMVNDIDFFGCISGDLREFAEEFRHQGFGGFLPSALENETYKMHVSYHPMHGFFGLQCKCRYLVAQPFEPLNPEAWYWDGNKSSAVNLLPLPAMAQYREKYGLEVSHE
jgi:hypothetical protein